MFYSNNLPFTEDELNVILEFALEAQAFVPASVVDAMDISDSCLEEIMNKLKEFMSTPKNSYAPLPPDTLTETDLNKSIKDALDTMGISARSLGLDETITDDMLFGFQCFSLEAKNAEVHEALSIVTAAADHATADLFGLYGYKDGVAVWLRDFPCDEGHSVAWQEGFKVLSILNTYFAIKKPEFFVRKPKEFTWRGDWVNLD